MLSTIGFLQSYSSEEPEAGKEGYTLDTSKLSQWDSEGEKQKKTKTCKSFKVISVGKPGLCLACINL